MNIKILNRSQHELHEVPALCVIISGCLTAVFPLSIIIKKLWVLGDGSYPDMCVLNMNRLDGKILKNQQGPPRVFDEYSETTTKAVAKVG